jgi:tRNA1(Val) A37 N6-methylase TrmN6
MKSSKSPEIELRADERVDEFLDGRLRLIQSQGGYRFSVDAVLLAEFVTVKPEDIVIDLGTGCGVIPLMLLLRKPVRYAFGLEIQEHLAYQASRNAVLNGCGGKMGVILGDIKHPPIAKECADVVVCNPPYRPARNGRINPDPRRAIARHELLTSTEEILGTARRLLRAKGRVAMVYPSARLVDILVKMRRFELEPKRIQVGYPTIRSGAKLALIEAFLGGRPGVDIRPPLIGQGRFSIS